MKNISFPSPFFLILTFLILSIFLPFGGLVAQVNKVAASGKTNSTSFTHNYYFKDSIKPWQKNILFRDLKNQQKNISHVLNAISNKSTPLGTISVNIVPNGTTCGYSDGSFTVFASGGTPPYTYSENGYPFQTGALFLSKAPGVYNVTVKDAAGLTATSTVTLTNTYPPPSIGLTTYTVPTPCSGMNGSVTVWASGGTPPYSFSDDFINWQSSNTFNNLPAVYGYFSFFVRDANGCIYPYNFPFFGSDCPMGFQVSGYNASCSSTGGIQINNPQGGIPPYTYSIDGINYQTSGIFPGPLSPGIVYMYMKDATGTIALYMEQIFATACQLTISNAVTTDAHCHISDGQVVITASNGNPPYQYSLDGLNFQTSNTFTGLSPGINYSLYVMDATGALYGGPQVIINENCPQISLIETDENCGSANGTITASASGGTGPYQFSKDGIIFQAGNVFNNLVSGTYTIYVKDFDGYMASATSTVNTICLTMVLDTIHASCGNDNGIITVNCSNGSPPYSYSKDGINFQSGNQFNNLDSGIYIITLVDAAGTKITDTTYVSKTFVPSINATAIMASCYNNDGSIQINAAGGSFPLQYSIDDGLNFQSANSFISLDSGSYIVVVKDADGCLNKSSIQITAAPKPNVWLGNDTTLCMGNSLMLTTPLITGLTYLWQDNSTGNSLLVNKTGTYYVKVTDQSDCSSTDTINVKFNPLPTFNLGNDTSICDGMTLLLTPAVPSNAICLWNNGNTTNTLRVQFPGLYWLQVTSGGCFRRDSINVNYKLNPILKLGNDTTLCEGQTILLDATNTNSTYLWQDGSVSPTYNVSTPGQYSVKVMMNGCDTTGDISVVYNSKPILNLLTDTTLCVSEQILLDAHSPQSNYLWQDGSTLPTYEVSQSGTYSVQVSNSCGSTSASSIINFKDCSCKFSVPNAFTPNNDGLNDIFRPKYICLFSNYNMKIFNRWGQLVFTSKDPSSGWDGNMGGQPQPMGTYVWMISYLDQLTNKNTIEHGTVILVR